MRREKVRKEETRGGQVDDDMQRRGGQWLK